MENDTFSESDTENETYIEPAELLIMKNNFNKNTYAQSKKNKLYAKIEIIVLMLHLPYIVYESTKIIYEKVVEHNKEQDKIRIFRAKTLNRVLAACIIKACEINEINDIDAIIDDLCQHYRVNKKDLRKIVNKYFPSEYFDTHINIIKKNIYSVCRKLKFSEEIQNFCINVLNNCNKLNLLDHYPITMAAGIIYFVSKYKKIDLSLKLLSDIVEINKIAISKICGELMLEPCAIVIVDSELTDFVYKELFNK